MSKGKTAIHEKVREALEGGRALTSAEIRGQRNRSKEAIFRFKAAFWIAIGLFNLILWVPMPLPRPLLIAGAVICLAFAFIVPVVGIRRHNRIIDLLQDAESAPKKRQVSEAGRTYMEQVRSEGRPLIKAEIELLTGSRAPAAE